MRLGVLYRYHRDQDMGHFVILKNGSLGASKFNSTYLLCCMCACVHVLCCANTTVTVTYGFLFSLQNLEANQNKYLALISEVWVTQQ